MEKTDGRKNRNGFQRALALMGDGRDSVPLLLPRLKIADGSPEVLDRKTPASIDNVRCNSFSRRGLRSSSFVKVGSAML